MTQTLTLEVPKTGTVGIPLQGVVRLAGDPPIDKQKVGLTITPVRGKSEHIELAPTDVDGKTVFTFTPKGGGDHSFTASIGEKGPSVGEWVKVEAADNARPMTPPNGALFTPPSTVSSQGPTGGRPTTAEQEFELGGDDGKYRPGPKPSADSDTGEFSVVTSRGRIFAAAGIIAGIAAIFIALVMMGRSDKEQNVAASDMKISATATAQSTGGLASADTKTLRDNVNSASPTPPASPTPSATEPQKTPDPTEAVTGQGAADVSGGLKGTWPMFKDGKGGEVQGLVTAKKCDPKTAKCIFGEFDIAGVVRELSAKVEGIANTVAGLVAESKKPKPVSATPESVAALEKRVKAVEEKQSAFAAKADLENAISALDSFTGGLDGLDDRLAEMQKQAAAFGARDKEIVASVAKLEVAVDKAKSDAARALQQAKAAPSAPAAAPVKTETKISVATRAPASAKPTAKAKRKQATIAIATVSSPPAPEPFWPVSGHFYDSSRSGGVERLTLRDGACPSRMRTYSDGSFIFVCE